MPTLPFTNLVTLERVVKSLNHLDSTIDASDTSTLDADAVILPLSSVSTLSSISNSQENDLYDTDLQLIVPAREALSNIVSADAYVTEAEGEADGEWENGKVNDSDDEADDEAENDLDDEAEIDSDNEANMPLPPPLSSLISPRPRTGNSPDSGDEKHYLSTRMWIQQQSASRSTTVAGTPRRLEHA